MTEAISIPEPSDLPIAKVESLATHLVAWSRDADMDGALDALDRALALEEYLAKRDMAGPLQIAERHLERRIGELLGPAEMGRPQQESSAATELKKTARHEFRLIAAQWPSVEKVLPCSRAEAIRQAQKSQKTKDEEPPADCTLEQWHSLSDHERERILSFVGAEKFNRQEEPQQDVVIGGRDQGNIEWALWSWNPITGCLHNCPYCYARDIANRFYAEGFQPVLRPRRLSAPANTVPPKATNDPIRNMGNRNVFTCSMADLFGKWVPQEWIEAVLQQVYANPQWNFLFLTKFPVRLSEFEFPDNAWVGTTVDCQARVRNAERSFRKVRAKVRWLSVEPMLEPLQFKDLGAFEWIVLGGASPSNQTPAWHPPRDWSDDLRRQAAALGVRVYEKTNLLNRVREYPTLDTGEAPLPRPLAYLPSMEQMES